MQDKRQEVLNRARSGFERCETDLLIESVIQNEIDALRLSEHITDSELNEAIDEFERFRDEINQQGLFLILSLSLSINPFQGLILLVFLFKLLLLFMKTHLWSYRSFRVCRFQKRFSEIESMIAYEQERLEDLTNGYSSVLCPRCQVWLGVGHFISHSF